MNALETKISDSLRKQGWTVLKRGWPDFLIYREQAGRLLVAGVEVKSDRDTLSEQQEAMHRILRAVGLPVHTLRPEFVSKSRIGKTRAALTATERLDARSQISELRAELGRLQQRIQEAESALEETIVVFNEPERKTAVLGNSGITQPTKEQAMLNAATQLEAFLERKEAA